jgi:hypothetical protein
VSPPAVIWCRCISCGAEEEMRHKGGAQYDEPKGWIAFQAQHWPPGIGPGSLQVRLCGHCLMRCLARAGRVCGGCLIAHLAEPG